MSEIRAGDRVAIHYRVRGEDGSELDSSQGEDPIVVTAGGDDVLCGVSEALIGMALGERRLLRLEPGLGFGRRLGLERAVPVASLPAGVRDGDAVQLTMGSAGATLWVRRIEGDEAVLSTDHALAGDTITVEIFIAAIEAPPPAG